MSLFSVMTGMNKLTADVAKTYLDSVSMGMFRSRVRRVKSDEPDMHDTMKVAKMSPKGRESESEEESLLRILSSPSSTPPPPFPINAGVHMNTKVYILPSKRLVIAPQRVILVLPRTREMPSFTREMPLDREEPEVEEEEPELEEESSP